MIPVNQRYADLVHRFAFHPADCKQKKEADERVRSACLALALELNDLLPDGREKSLAITHLEQVCMWANAAIARADSPSPTPAPALSLAPAS
jgi:hypothetical protein